MHVVGTAGHVDHGKTALVAALTGVDCDRLAEERRRGMTIELGFAAWRLRSGRQVGIVDVPGHQRLVRTMVAGAQGIDLVLLVVAADEGVMPQTREHLDICSLLGVRAAVVALTKADLVDAETLDLAAVEVSEQLATTALRGAHLVPVSVRDGRGLESLDAAVEDALRDLPPRPDRGRPRLFVDRAFSVPGFGPVVTGTLEGGRLRTGDDVVLLPDGERARVRGLQRHGAAAAEAEPGGRTAVNLAGVDLTRLRRGLALAAPGTLRCTRRLDVRLEAASAAPAAIRHGATVRLHLGTVETDARVWLLEGDELPPAGGGLAQLTLAEPVPAVPGDRLVLRRAAPSATLGGGEVLDVAPRRHRRGDPAIAATLIARTGAGLEALVAAELGKRRLGAEAGELGAVCGAGAALVEAALAILDPAPVRLGRRRVAASRWAELAGASRELLARAHDADPLRPGLPREEWRGRLHLPAALATEVIRTLGAAGEIVERGSHLGLPGRGVEVDERSRRSVDALTALLDARALDPPAAAELRDAGMTPGLLALLVAEGRAVRLGPDLVVSAAAYEAARRGVEAHLAAHGVAGVAELRDALGTTRRVMVPLLEHLDAARVTVRQGDLRRLRTPTPTRRS